MSKTNKKADSIPMEPIDTYFDKHRVTPLNYFLAGAVLSSTHSIVNHTIDDPGLLLPFIFPLLIVWLVWLGPRYLQRHNRKLVAALGTLAFFLPWFVEAVLLWLGQPGWPLDNLMGDRYTDVFGPIIVVGWMVVVYLLIRIRIALYSKVSVKRHSKKDLFQ